VVDLAEGELPTRFFSHVSGEKGNRSNQGEKEREPLWVRSALRCSWGDSPKTP
jgi:hypothetical protein